MEEDDTFFLISCRTKEALCPYAFELMEEAHRCNSQPQGEADLSELIIISERRRETRHEASRRSTQRAFFHSHMGKQNNIITRETLILN